MKKLFEMGVMLFVAMLVIAIAGCNTYKVTYFNKDGTPYCQMDVSLSEIGKITESTKDKSWVKWHNGVIVLGELTISSETNGMPCFKGMFGDYDDGIAFFVKDQKDFEGMAKVVAAARRNSTTAKMDASGMTITNEKENTKTLSAPGVNAPVKYDGTIKVPEFPAMPVPPNAPEVKKQ